MTVGNRSIAHSNVERIASAIAIIRGHKVLLDTSLAALYGVTVKRLNEQIRRNPTRFPPDFAFRLTAAEHANLRSQNATSSSAHGGRRYPPYAFTEHGAIMAAAVLNSPVAIEVGVYVVRAFVRLREALASNAEIRRKLDELDRKYSRHDHAVVHILRTLRELTEPHEPASSRRMGFIKDE
jgi:hypothetical protein